MSNPYTELNFEELVLRQQQIYLTKTEGRNLPIVMMGTGHLGKRLFQGLRALGIEVLDWCDNNPNLWECELLGHKVHSVQNAVANYGAQAVFVVGIYNGLAARRQLQELGCKYVVSAATVCRHFGGPLLPLDGICTPSVFFQEISAVLSCRTLWADETSVREYDQLLHWFLATGETFLPEHDAPSETYFPAALWKETPAEHFVDCGAFDGDSVLAFIKHQDGKYAAVTAFEPDPNNYQAFRRNLESLSASDQSKIEVVNAAVGEASGQVSFSATGTMGSSVKDGATVSVPCVALDDALARRPPATFIKMDIESYEIEALKGTRNIIHTHAPIMAICTYHKMEHLWQVPLLLHQFQPEYRLYLRRYAEDCWETVCYAVPPNRTV